MKLALGCLGLFALGCQPTIPSMPTVGQETRRQVVEAAGAQGPVAAETYDNCVNTIWEARSRAKNARFVANGFLFLGGLTATGAGGGALLFGENETAKGIGAGIAALGGLAALLSPFILPPGKAIQSFIRKREALDGVVDLAQADGTDKASAIVKQLRRCVNVGDE